MSTLIPSISPSPSTTSTTSTRSTSSSSPSSSTTPSSSSVVSSHSSGSTVAAVTSSDSTTSLTSSSSLLPATSSTTSTTTTSRPNVVTSTSTKFVTSSTRNVASPSSSAGNSEGGSTSFLQNKGAVAGVFSVVGLVGLALIFLLARNFYRRRQQEAFDRELQEATREAAATTAGPFFDDDDDDHFKRSFGGTDRQYSDMSHGTYNQAPIAAVDSYGMREIPPASNSAEMLYSSAGAAGIGIARARSRRLDDQQQQRLQQPDYSTAFPDGNTPYPAFAAPASGHLPTSVSDPYGAAGLRHPYSSPYNQPSLGNESADPSHYPGGIGHQSPPLPQQPVPSNRYSEVMDDPYGGVVDGEPGDARLLAPLPNPFERDMSDDGHQSHEEPRRVLKVANE